MVNDLESKLILRESDVLAVVNPRVAQVVHDGLKFATTSDPSLMSPEVKPRPYGGKYMVVDRPEDESLIPVSTDHAGNPTSKYPNRLASEMIYGFFGEIGYVDMVQQRDSPRLIGIVHIPRRLVYLIGAMKGDDGLERFYKEFCMEQGGDRWKKHRWNLKSHPTEFDQKVLQALPIEDEQYYWKIEKTESDVFKDGRPLTEQLADYQAAVREFVTRLDNHIWRLKPNANPTDVITPEIARERFAAIQQGKLKYLTTGDFTPK